MLDILVCLDFESLKRMNLRGMQGKCCDCAAIRQDLDGNWTVELNNEYFHYNNN